MQHQVEASADKWYFLFKETNTKCREAVEKISKKSADKLSTLPIENIVQQCTLQGGTHHTHLVQAVSNGRPLGSYQIPGLLLKWFRVRKSSANDLSTIDLSDNLIQGATNSFYQPSVDDIDHTLLLQILWKNSSVPLLLEYGPTVYDPTVKSQVESRVEQKQAVFSHLVFSDNRSGERSKDSSQTWTLIIGPKRIRFTCETALVPPYVATTNEQVKSFACVQNANAFHLKLDNSTILKNVMAPSHITRDVIVLTIKEFCAFNEEGNASAVDDPAESDVPCLETEEDRLISKLISEADILIQAGQVSCSLHRRQSDLVLQDVRSTETSSLTNQNSKEHEKETSSRIQELLVENQELQKRLLQAEVQHYA